jgi:hypothetical protein
MGLFGEDKGETTVMEDSGSLMDDMTSFQNALVPRKLDLSRKSKKEKKNEKRKRKKDAVGYPVGMETCSKCKYGIDPMNDYAKVRCTCSDCNPQYQEDLKTFVCYSFIKSEMVS